jgi:ketosteroid isomerase-like protein
MNSGPPQNEKTVDADVVEVLSGIEARLIHAFVTGDPSFHKEILADDWSVIDVTGRILTKGEVLKESFAGDKQISIGDIDEINVRPFGNWAIVTGRTHVVGQAGGEGFEVWLRFTDVFAFRNGNWLVVASQATLLNQ